MTVRPGAAALLGILVALPAVAQGSRPIPIERDIRKNEQVRRDLGWGPVGRKEELRGTGVTTGSNPSGVAGFDGPPGFVGDSVDSYGPLPPGSPGNEDW